MEFIRLSVLALFCLVIMGTDGSQLAEDYWQSVWPNTPLPKALLDLLLPVLMPIYWLEKNILSRPYRENFVSLSILYHDGVSIYLNSKTNLPIKAEEEKQYWTVFFEHDLHPGKKMSLGIHKRSDIQPFGVPFWRAKTSQPFGTRVWIAKTVEKERQSHNDFCGRPNAIGEDKYCASSLESMMDFAISKLGKDIKVISSSFAPNHDQYMVEEVKKIGDNMVMCHRMNYEKVVFYCHQINATTSYMVPLVASDGTKSKAIAICHHDTRGVNPDMLYQILEVKPGTVPVCHFVGNKAVAWVPNPIVSESNHPCVI